jgi:putative endonuclease
MATVGELGETLVARWLASRGWQILQCRWRCPWGEIDLIALSEKSSMLAFVEVKTRNARNWDSGGRLAIDRRKRQRLYNAASYFLSLHPRWSDFSCRFDVACVCCRQGVTVSVEEFSLEHSRLLSQGYELELQEYIESAFEGDL